MRLSVIIPALDEATSIAFRLRELTEMPGIAEIIVADGGSTDGTPVMAQSFIGVRVLVAPKGRARQMNAGAASAEGDVLLFLHADVGLPPDAAQLVEDALLDRAVVAGAFRTRTFADRPSILAPLLRLADLRSRYSSLPYGDQALFVRREAFVRVGGFPDQPLMEDVEMGRRLRRIGRIRTVPRTVRVSGRRWLSRPLFYTLVYNLFPMLYRMGVPARRLAALYGNPR